MNKLNSEQKRKPIGELLIYYVLWGACLASLVVYLIICHLIGSEYGNIGFDNDILWFLRGILAFISVTSLVFAYFIRKFMLTVPSEDSKQRVIQRILTAIVLFPSFGKNALARYGTAIILSIICAQSIGIFGLILFLINGEFVTLYIFVFSSATALYYFRPKYDEFERLAIDLKSNQDSN